MIVEIRRRKIQRRVILPRIDSWEYGAIGQRSDFLNQRLSVRITLFPPKKDEVNMKCIECQKEVETNENKIPPTWYGAFTTDRMLAVICSECIKNSEAHKRWTDRDLKSQLVD